jgi:hypothetical protein
MSVEIAGEVQGPEREDNQSVLDSISLGERNVTRESKIVKVKNARQSYDCKFLLQEYSEFAVQLKVNFPFNACPEALTDFFTMCNKIHEKGYAESGISFTRRRKAQYSQETPPEQTQLRFISIDLQWHCGSSYS